MSKKERIFYLDFVRAIAVVSILLTHFNALYLYTDPQLPEKAVITTTVANIYIGNWGVALFFIISGAALMYVYENRLELKTFYKKRFLSIYPMFWMAYVVAFLANVLIKHVIPGSGVPKWRIIFSVIGFDGLLLSNGVSTFYLLGEWFLGVIVLFYLIFPLLRAALNKNPIICWICVMVIYAASIYACSAFFPTLAPSTILLVRIPEVLFGMTFIKYRWKVKWPVTLIGLAALILNTVLKPDLSYCLQTTYVGIASFVVLVFCSYYLEKKPILWVCKILSKYSYAIFLVHHVIIAAIMNDYDLYTLSVTKSYLLFGKCCVVIAVFAFGLFMVHKYVMKFLSKWIPFLA